MYSIPYDSVTLSIGDSDVELTTMISLRDKSAIRNEFKYKGKKSFQLDLVIRLNLLFCYPQFKLYRQRFLPAEATIRDKYHKCFTCNLTGVPSKIYKIRTRLKIKVQALFTTNTNLSELLNPILPDVFEKKYFTKI